MRKVKSARRLAEWKAKVVIFTRKRLIGKFFVRGVDFHGIYSICSLKPAVPGKMHLSANAAATQDQKSSRKWCGVQVGKFMRGGSTGKESLPLSSSLSLPAFSPFSLSLPLPLNFIQKAFGYKAKTNFRLRAVFAKRELESTDVPIAVWTFFTIFADCHLFLARPCDIHWKARSEVMCGAYARGIGERFGNSVYREDVWDLD